MIEEISKNKSVLRPIRKTEFGAVLTTGKHLGTRLLNPVRTLSEKITEI